MSHGDPIADMLTRIRNAARVGKTEVRIRATKICQGIAEVLRHEGYILGYDRIDDGRQGFLRVQLKYSPQGESAITMIRRESSPGCRRYRSVDELPCVMNGMGISIVSTSKGVMSDKTCRQENVGGELLCTVS